MKIIKESFISVSAVALVLTMALCFPQIVLAAEANGGLDQAMQTFSQAIHNRNSQVVLASFSRATPCRFIDYDNVNYKPVYQTTVSYTQLARDFKTRKGWYEILLTDRKSSGAVFREDFGPGKKWHRQGTTFVLHPDNPNVFYLKWRQEGGKWVIVEIGRTGS
jgi:hypothetical protein